MILEIIEIENDTVCCVEEGTDIEITMSYLLLPKNKGIKVGSRLQVVVNELPKKLVYEENEEIGGFIKNNNRSKLVDY